MDISNYELDYENEFEDNLNKELEQNEETDTSKENEIDEKDNANNDTNTDVDTSEDNLSNEEKLVNYWIEKEYLMINPEEDKIESMEDALRIDAERRTDFIKDKLIEQFPEDFRILADGVINHGVKDIRKILELMAGQTSNENTAVTEEKAIETLKAHYTDLGYDADEIDMDVASLKSKNKLIPAAERLIARQNEVENKAKQLEMQQEVERQKIAEADNLRQYQEHQNLIANEFKQKTWKDGTKRQIAEEYFKGVTVEKVKHLLTNPTTAADFAMLVSRMFKTDNKGTISLNMDSLVDLASAREAKNIKNKMQQKAFGSPVRFGNVKRATQPDLDSDYDFTI